MRKTCHLPILIRKTTRSGEEKHEPVFRQPKELHGRPSEIWDLGPIHDAGSAGLTVFVQGEQQLQRMNAKSTADRQQRSGTRMMREHLLLQSPLALLEVAGPVQRDSTGVLGH